MKPSKFTTLALFPFLLCGLYINSTTSLRLKLAEHYINAGNYDNAIIVCQKAIRKDAISDTSNNLLYKKLAQAYAGKKMWYSVAKNIKATSPIYFMELDNEIDNYHLGTFLMCLGEYKEAIKYFNEALKIKPGFLDVFKKLKNCYMKIGDESNTSLLSKKIEEIEIKYPNIDSLMANTQVVKIDIPIPNSDFELERDGYPNFPANWTYYYCTKKEPDAFGISRDSYKGRYAGYIRQIKNNGIYLSTCQAWFKSAPSDKYEICASTHYQISAWLKADNPIDVDIMIIEYDNQGKMAFKLLSTVKVTKTYQHFTPPVFLTNNDTVTYRISFRLLNNFGTVFVDDVSLSEYLFFELE
jgi:tetratricopeptide (TPR) repeat protein